MAAMGFSGRMDYIDEISDEELEDVSVKPSRVIPWKVVENRAPEYDCINTTDFEDFDFRPIVKVDEFRREPRTRVTRPPARDTNNFVYGDGDDDDDIDEVKPETSTVEPEKKRRGRQLRIVDDDSSDDEFVPDEERNGKKARRTLADMGDDDFFENQTFDSGVIHLEDDRFSSFQAPVKTEDIIKQTLQKCDNIAASLRNELLFVNSTKGLSLDTSYMESGLTRIVTQADVQAACEMVGTAEQTSLKPYQLVGVNFLLLLFRKHLGGAILADEMGLGKTVQAIVFLALLKYFEGDSGPHLIVTPASVLENWERELQKWCPGLSVVSFHGSERTALKDDLYLAAKSGDRPPFDVFLTGYSLFERRSASSKDDRSMLKKWKWSCVLMDEGHLLKDRNSLRSKHLKSVAQHAKHRLMITGTPLQNDLQELWSLLEFMMPNIFKNCEFDELLEQRNGRKVVTAENMELINHIKTILGPFVLRRVKADVMHQLLPKIHRVECLEMVQSQDSAYKEALTGYRALAAQSAKSALPQHPGKKNPITSLSRRQVSSIFTELRKLANHPLLVRRVYTNKDVEKLARACRKAGIFGDECTIERIKEELSSYSDFSLHKLCTSHTSLTSQVKLTEKHALQSAKCQVLSKLLPELRQQGHRPLIFSQWTNMLDILEWLLQVLKIKYNRLDGSTAVSERQTLVDEYNNDEGIFAFLLSTRAGGQGLNLTGADTVIIHDVDFNPQMDRQAEDRCHRIGQSKPVTIYRLVTKATVDESIFGIAQRKLVLDAVLDGSKSDSAADDKESNNETMGQILSAILCDN